MNIEKGKFGAEVITRQVSRWEFQLVEPLVFNDPIHGVRQVPADFVSNLASIRILREICRWAAVVAVVSAVCAWGWLSNICWLIAVAALALYGLLVGYGMRSSILHDWEYTIGELSRSQCDALYERALHSGDGTARWRSKGLFWTGVRLAGARHYQDKAEV